MSAFPGKVLERVFASWFVGYGYRVGRALIILLLLGMGFGCFYQQAFEQGTIVPSDKDIREEVATDCNNLPAPACPVLVGKLVSFNPWIYSADVMIPIIGLGQKSAWRPAYNDQLVNNVQLAETVLGWVGGLLLVSFVSGLIKKE